MTTKPEQPEGRNTLNIEEPTHRRNGTCPCGKLARPRQGYCLDCHNAANKKYRDRKAKIHQQDHAGHLALIAERLHNG